MADCGRSWQSEVMHLAHIYCLTRNFYFGQTLDNKIHLLLYYILYVEFYLSYPLRNLLRKKKYWQFQRYSSISDRYNMVLKHITLWAASDFLQCCLSFRDQAVFNNEDFRTLLLKCPKLYQPDFYSLIFINKRTRIILTCDISVVSYLNIAIISQTTWIEYNRITVAVAPSLFKRYEFLFYRPLAILQHTLSRNLYRT